MQENIWYNVRMPVTVEKKSENLALKVQATFLQTLGEIAEHEDRPLGYVARELMMRGLALYRQDGKLRNEQTVNIPIMKKGVK